MNWCEALSNTALQKTYAKDAKAPAPAPDPSLLHLLHTKASRSETEFAGEMLGL
jgi:hypothetical protein